MSLVPSNRMYSTCPIPLGFLTKYRSLNATVAQSESSRLELILRTIELKIVTTASHDTGTFVSLNIAG